MSSIATPVARMISSHPCTFLGRKLIAPRNESYSTEKSVEFEVPPYKLHLLKEAPTTTPKLTAQEALDMYSIMSTLRKLETAGSNLYKAKLIGGFCHLFAGQEAVAAGIRSAMRNMDTLITSYRCHAWTYLMGATLEQVLSELTGRETGVSRGRGGSMHMFTDRMYGGNGIVGAQIPLGTGLAFAHKYKNDGGVCFVLYGDGAANQGQVFEAFNMAALLKLPCCFVCENNIYGMGTSAQRSSASVEYYKRGDYIPGIWVDGMNALATREVSRFAIDYITSGKGPIILEMETYRYFGHSMSDPGTSYRSREEVQEVRKTRDPVNTFKKKILDANLVDAEQLAAIDTEAKKLVDEATKKAKTSPVPAAHTLSADVYHLNLEGDIRNVVPDIPLKHTEIAKRG